MKHSSASAAALDAGNVVGYNGDKIIRLRPHSDKANAGSSEKRSLVNGFGPKGETGKGDEGGAGEQPLFALNAAEFVSAFGIGLLFALLQASLGGYVLFGARLGSRARRAVDVRHNNRCLLAFLRLD